MTQLGQLMREWRAARGLSQLDLAMRAGFSARHLSFIETGRTQPSRQALLVIAETLDMPLRDRNRLLEAGGYAHVYGETALDAEEMRHLRGVLQFILDRHEPYGAVVLDRYSNVLMANRAATEFLGQLVDPQVATSSPNLLRWIFHPLGIRQCIANWEEVGTQVWGRAERELRHLKGDQAALALLEELEQYVEPALRRKPGAPASTAELLLPVHIRKEQLDVRIFSTIMTLGTPRDVTLQELRIETFFPADRDSERQIRGAADA